MFGASSSAVTENTPLTPAEQKEIARRLDEAAEYMSKTTSLSAVHKEALEEKVKFLVDASARLGRKDWLIVFMGVVLPFILSASLPPESARTIFTTFLRGIGVLYPELPLLE